MTHPTSTPAAFVWTWLLTEKNGTEFPLEPRFFRTREKAVAEADRFLTSFDAEPVWSDVAGNEAGLFAKATCGDGSTLLVLAYPLA